MPDHITSPDLRHGAAWRIAVKSASRLSDGTLLVVSSMGSAITFDPDDAKKIAAAMKEHP